MRYKYLLFALFSVLFSGSFAQELFGKITDFETQQGIPGAKIQFLDETGENILATTITDTSGNYSAKLQYTGRVNSIVSSTGYQPKEIRDILVSHTSAIQLEVALMPLMSELSEVTIVPKLVPQDAINRMAAVSAYGITPENVDRFAGSLDDPMRAITALPGVNAGSSRYNNFSVRGNPPIGMLYRLEGIPIHNPNHFAVIGSTGGFVTQFSSHLLATSDFFSSAFPAEYGNATSAVFDFRFRKGNPNEYVHAFKAGVLGFDVASEGPLSKKNKSSYLINYRYSTLGVLARVINLGGVLPSYQDISFNFNLPTKKAGTFKVFGVGGLSNFLLAVEKDPTQWDSTTRRVERSYGSNSGAFGITHTVKTSAKSYWHSVAAISAGEYFDKSDYLEDDLSWSPREFALYNDQRFTITSDYNHSFSRRHTNKTGVIFTHINHDFFDRKFNRNFNSMAYLTRTEGTAQTYQIFSQSKFRLTEKTTLMAGVHGLYFGLNQKLSIEPRLGLNIKLSDRSMLAAGYGLHSRVEDLSIYHYRETDPLSNEIIRPNDDLDLMKSHQAVLRFSQILFKNHKLSIEGYFQYATDIPGALNGSTTVQNLFYTYGFQNMENVGEGRNTGLELMLERYAKKGMYYIISASVFDSQYKGGDGIWRNTQYNQRYALNILMGKEYRLKPKNEKDRLLGINFNYHHTGGAWQTPIDSLASRTIGWTQYNLDEAFTQQQPMLYNLDFSLTLKGIRKRVTGEFVFSIKNLLYKRTVISQYFDYKTDKVIDIKDYGMIPVISYKITF